MPTTREAASGDAVRVPGAPPIPGLAFRRFRGEADYPLMVGILDACNDVDGLEYVNSVDDQARLFAHLTNCDPVQDMLFAEVERQTVAFSRVWWRVDTSGVRRYVCLGFVHPAWRRKGLGRAMLRYNEGRLRQIAAGHPAGVEKCFHTWTTDREPGTQALLAGAGYAVARTFVEMLRPIAAPLPPTALPEGLELRPAAPHHYRQIWEARLDAYQDHWGYAPSTEADYQGWLDQSIFTPKVWKVAWEGDQVAGMVLNRLNADENERYRRQRGYTQDVFVRRPWRRRGLARALLVASIEMFQEMGMEETGLTVDAENPSGALRLYASVGYRQHMHHFIFQKPLKAED